MQAQQDFNVCAARIDAQRRDFLRVQAEPILFQRHVQALHPSHFAETQGQFRVVGVIDLNTVAALFLGHVARHVGSTKRGFEGGRVLRNMHQTDTHGGHEWPALPYEVQVLHGQAQVLGNFLRRLRPTVLQQDAELVAPQAGQRIALAQPGLQQRADMPQQLITRRMAAGIVDQFELVEVKEHQGMPPRLARQVVQRLLKAILEFATIGQAGQGIVSGLPRQIGDVLPLLSHVVQYQYGAADLAGIADRCTDQRNRNRTAVQTLDQFGMLAAATELTAQNAFDQGRTVGLGVLVQQIEQRCQRQTRRLLGLPVGQRLGGGVHVGDGACDVRGNHAIAN
ncbi:hypothetical protein D3C87_1187440 [compost metagenome]